MGRYDFDKERAIKGINPKFYRQAKVVILNGNDYVAFMKNSGVMYSLPKSLVEEQLKGRAMSVIIVNTSGRLIDTNLDLCEECGEPILNRGNFPYCCPECEEIGGWNEV